MSVNLMSAIFETEFFDIKDEDGNVTKASTAKLVLLAMADHANDEGEGVYPSVERLCRKTALSEQTIRNSFDALRYNGIISLAGKSKYNTNNHTINTKSFPKAKGKEVTVLTLYPLDPLTDGLLPPNGYAKLTYPLDPNQEPSIKTSLKTDEEKPAYRPSGIEQKIWAGLPIEQGDIPETQLREKKAINAFESAFNVLRPWDWYPAKTSMEKTWRDFRAFLVELYEADHDCFTKYVTWTRVPYAKGTMTSLGIKRNPENFPDSWNCFLASDSMYGLVNKTSDIPNRGIQVT